MRFCCGTKVTHSNNSENDESTHLALSDALGANFEDGGKQNLQRQKQVQRLESGQYLTPLVRDANAHQIQDTAHELPISQSVLHLTDDARAAMDMQQPRDGLRAALNRRLHEPSVPRERSVFSALVRHHRGEVQHVRSDTASVLRYLQPPPVWSS